MGDSVFSSPLQKAKFWQMWADKLSLQVAYLQTIDKQQQQKNNLVFNLIVVKVLTDHLRYLRYAS